MREITIKDILDIIKKRWIWLVLIPLLAGAGARLYDHYRQQPPQQYTASTRLYVLMEYVDSMGQLRYDTATSSQFAGDFKELIQTKQVYQETAERLGTDISMMDGVKIGISAISGTRVLIISATSASPVLSMNVANTISQVFVEHITRIMKTDAVSIAAEATLPEAPPEGKNGVGYKNTLMAAMLAFALMAGLFLLLEIMNTRIKTAQEAENILQAPVLASIPDYRNVLSRYRKNPDTTQPLSEAVSPATLEGVKTLSANLQFGRAGEAMGAIMVTSAMPTDGKSALTLMLAEALAEDGFHVLVCDLDVKFPSLGQYVGRRNALDIIDYLAGKASFDQIVTETRKPAVSFVDFSHQSYSISQIVKHPGFLRFLEEAKKNFSVVLFDTCPLGLFIDAALLSPLVDGALVVLGSDMVERVLARGVLGQLKKANANVLGVALNYAQVSRRDKQGYGGYGRQERQRPQRKRGPALEEMPSHSREE